jgi:hypothetical protein
MKAVVRDDTDTSKRLLLLHEDVTGPGKTHICRHFGPAVAVALPASEPELAAACALVYLSAACLKPCRPGGFTGPPEAAGAPGRPGSRGSPAGAGLPVLAGRPHTEGEYWHALLYASMKWQVVGA